ncbi:MAG: hypothetical protein WCH11_03830 [Bdellovibrio sp.]
MGSWYKIHSIRTAVLLGMAVSMMGNESCEKKAVAPEIPSERQLRRRVQLGQIEAPQIQLPNNQQYGGRVFDFAFVANAQMAKVLRDTRTFSTATIDPYQSFSPEGLTEESKDEFYNCQLVEDTPEQKILSYQQKARGWTEEAACMIDMPAGILSGSVLDFSFKNKKGVDLSLAGIPFFQGASFDFETYQLSAEMKMSAPLQRGQHAELATVRDTQIRNRSTAMKFGFSLGPISLGPKLYFNSTNNTLREAVTNVFSDSVREIYSQWRAQEPWYGMVLKDCDRRIFLNAGRGSDAGLVVGDVVKVVNVLYRFDGPVCQSYLQSDLARLEDPVAYARIVAVGRNIAEAAIIENDARYPINRLCVINPDGTQSCSGRPRIKPGARAYEYALVKPGSPQ